MVILSWTYSSLWWWLMFYVPSGYSAMDAWPSQINASTVSLLIAIELINSCTRYVLYVIWYTDCAVWRKKMPHFCFDIPNKISMVSYYFVNIKISWNCSPWCWLPHLILTLVMTRQQPLLKQLIKMEPPLNKRLLPLAIWPRNSLMNGLNLKKCLVLNNFIKRISIYTIRICIYTITDRKKIWFYYV